MKKPSFLFRIIPTIPAEVVFLAALAGSSVEVRADATGAYTLDGGTASPSNLTETATAADESGILVFGSGSLTVGTVSITTSGSASSTTSSDQYGTNAAVLAGSSTSTGTITITGSANTITTTGAVANGLFATGSGSSVSMTGGAITTSGSNAHGVDATYGGSITLTNVDVTTSAASSSAIATDYGGGTVTVTGGTITTSGGQSAGIYSTGNITVNNATVTSQADCGGVIDGANTIVLNDTALTGDEQGFKLWKTAPATGNATVTITGGSLTANTGTAFYVTGTAGNAAAAVITVNGATLSPGNDILVDADDGSTATFTAEKETLTGNLITDSSSTIKAALESGTSLTGQINAAALTVDSTSSWTVSAASTLTSLETSGTVAFASPSNEVTVTGTATLGGALVVDLGAAPVAGTYVLFSANSVSGTFSSLSINPSLPTGFSAELTYSSTTVTLTVTGSSSGSAAAPTLTSEPISLSVAAGATAIFSVNASGSSLTYQWYLDGVAVSGATGSTLIVSDATSGAAGNYTVVVSNSSGSATSTAATLTVVVTLDPGRIVNLSSRAYVGTGSEILIAGFVVGGSRTGGTEPVLLRGVGPQLASLDVTGALAAPVLSLYLGSTQIAENAGWGGSSTITSEDSAVGAFALTSATSLDSALFEPSLESGSYTVQISGASSTTGIALAEIYDATTAYSSTTPHLINISSRAFIGTGSQILIAGFVIGGSTSKTVLIRASGPALAAYGLSGTLSDPQLELYDSSGTLLAGNTSWGGNSAIAAEAAAVGAFSWTSDTSADSALLVTLSPGSYTAEVSGASGDTGLALVEVYDVP